ncbi:dTDP-glucose 4,6-dehydratase [Pontibacter ramchanderi]|uniref:dTDP-glucose 4,6-dehydratase n=1 Tax=Pontibacter ramchanderi TaxID=1179743 RepID=A0A2N3UCJ7_9BACT|nr:dTDP-glucose 4,6-dehydratase [Pontibacter ramchanderi]PKV67086.1 dTDP-glucose 4,6-dehydratase [Pontibacter ramchanderi]
MNLLITGGAGFIGSHVVRLFVEQYPHYRIFNLDALTYAGNLQNLRDVEGRENYTFLKGDITDAAYLDSIFAERKFEAVIHLAAESHVDRSIAGPMAFVETNVVGTVNLLEACRRSWQGDYAGRLFYHVSTDEVYGSLGAEGLFTESTPYDPRSPYSASKAASDHFVRAWHHTYGLPVKLSNCSNNYGPNHFPEKLIPLAIHNIKAGKPVPVYGRGENVRDWLYVKDHARAIDAIFHRGKVGETYNVGGVNEWRNLDLVELLCDVMDERLGREPGTSRKLITFVKDRAGHDARYAIDSSKLMGELGWRPSVTFEQGLRRTVDWYLANEAWLEEVTSGHYRDYYREQYEER